MVDRSPDRRDEPVYDLARIQELARIGLVKFASSRVESDSQNLGYGPEAVADCIASLQAEEFDESLRYAKDSFWQDVYRVRRTSPKGEEDDLYIKLKLNRNCVTVLLHSFHQHR